MNGMYTITYKHWVTQSDATTIDCFNALLYLFIFKGGLNHIFSPWFGYSFGIIQLYTESHIAMLL